MFKATLKESKFSRSGWDTYEDECYVYVYCNSKEGLEEEIRDYIKRNTYESKGDFGCTLSSTSYKVVKKEEIHPEKVVNSYK